MKPALENFNIDFFDLYYFDNTPQKIIININNLSLVDHVSFKGVTGFDIHIFSKEDVIFNNLKESILSEFKNKYNVVILNKANTEDGRIPTIY